MLGLPDIDSEARPLNGAGVVTSFALGTPWVSVLGIRVHPMTPAA